MPELNMYTVRPNDDGLTRFVTRGIEDILPVPELDTPSRPPTDAEWDEEVEHIQSSDPSIVGRDNSTNNTSKCHNVSSVHSPLYIDASNLSRNNTPIQEMASPNGPITSISGFLSNSPVSFTLSPTTSHPDSHEFRKASDTSYPMSTSQSPSTPHSAPILYPVDFTRHYWDCEEALDLASTTYTTASTQNSSYLPPLSDDQRSCPPSSSPALPIISTAIASAVDVMQQWIDSRCADATSACTATAADPLKADQDVFLNSIHETIKLLLFLATNNNPPGSSMEVAIPSVLVPPPPATPAEPMDALTAALLAPPACCNSPTYESSSDCVEGPSICVDQCAESNVPVLSQHPQFNQDERNPMPSPIQAHYPFKDQSTEDASLRASPSGSPSIACQVPMILQALQRLCTCQGDSLNERVTDLLEKLRTILSALAESTAVKQTLNTSVPSTPTFASVGTQSDQLESQRSANGVNNGGEVAFRRGSTTGHSELSDPRLQRMDGRVRGPLRASTGTNPLQLFSNHNMKRCPLGKRTSASFPLDHSVYVTQSSILQTVVVTDDTAPSSASKPEACDHRIGPTRRKQRALSESSNARHHLLIDPAMIQVTATHTFPLKSDVKKCRKVYGVENRSQWCNQCRWKKACRRFPDVMARRSTAHQITPQNTTTTITDSVSSTFCATTSASGSPLSQAEVISSCSASLYGHQRSSILNTSHS